MAWTLGYLKQPLDISDSLPVLPVLVLLLPLEVAQVAESQRKLLSFQVYSMPPQLTHTSYSA